MMPVPVIPGSKIAVWFSRGAASAVAAKETIKFYDGCDIRILTNPVIEEDTDNIRFEKDVERWLGVKIEHVTHPDFPLASARDVWERRKGMVFPKGAPCTTLLKKNARQIWEINNHVDWHVLGFTFDEQKRFNRFVQTERENVLPVLIQAQITKQDCIDILVDAGIQIPRIYSFGFPNANCVGCVKATSPTYWNAVRKYFPEVFKDRSEQSREIGSKLVRVKNKRIFLDELDPRAKGNPMKSMTLECGTFCEEPTK